MKYLKLYENKILNDILDKISDNGESTLTDWEKEFLTSYEDVHKREKMEKEKRASDKPVFVEDELSPDMYPNDDGIIDSVEDEMDELEKHWDTISIDDMNEFFKLFNVGGDYGDSSWKEIPPMLKHVFKTFLRQKGLLNNY